MDAFIPRAAGPWDCSGCPVRPSEFFGPWLDKHDGLSRSMASQCMALATGGRQAARDASSVQESGRQGNAHSHGARRPVRGRAYSEALAGSAVQRIRERLMPTG